MTASRKQARADLKAYLQPLMTLVAAQDFYAFEPADYKGRSPVVFLSSGGASHNKTVLKALDSTFFVNVHLLTLYADMQASTYNEEDASDLLDDMEQQLSAAVEAKPVYPTKWQELAYEDRTIADEPQQIGGELYLHEVVTLRVRMY